jgi:hypothetical protein
VQQEYALGSQVDDLCDQVELTLNFTTGVPKSGRVGLR